MYPARGGNNMGMTKDGGSRRRRLVAALWTSACGSTEGEQGTDPGETQADESSASATIGDSSSSSSSSGPVTSTTTSAESSSTERSSSEDDGPPGGFDVYAIPDAAEETGPVLCGCAEGTDVIYVLSDAAELWSFDPDNLEFELVGGFACDGMSSTFSMGVDRNAIAWVMFQGSDIYNIDINSPDACVDPGYTPGQLGFDLFGMAFVSESQDNPCDQLYAQSFTGSFGSEGPGIGALGTLDPDDLTMTELGPTDFDGGELTGTGDGRLFMFAGADPAKLVELDKSDASVISIFELETLELTNAFAFSFFAGDFYFFTEAGFTGDSQVTHLDFDGDQELEVVVEQAPIRIVGAGVSTCAPVYPPN
ncbi:MAG: hypothetical protein IAG13_26170 [Deltaproteobacteria bacterium]|nr:hypothetical protein [Nannocystaceae bacterium]